MMTSSIHPRCLVLFRPESSRTRIRLIGVPYAGGAAAAYRNWARWLPDDVAFWGLEFPGHGTRFQEPPCVSMPRLIVEARDAVRALPAAPWALFGHSLGAVVAYELTRRLQEDHSPLPQRLYLSGQRALHRPSPRGPLHHLPDREFLEEIRRYGGTPLEVFENEELRSIFLPILRADFTLGETYRHVPAAPLECPVSAYGGLQDAEVSPDDVKSWRQYTTRHFNARLFPGGHFFLHEHEELLVSRLVEDLRAES